MNIKIFILIFVLLIIVTASGIFIYKYTKQDSQSKINKVYPSDAENNLVSAKDVLGNLLNNDFDDLINEYVIEQEQKYQNAIDEESSDPAVRICSSQRIEPCKPGYVPTSVPDLTDTNSPQQTVTCCVIDPGNFNAQKVTDITKTIQTISLNIITDPGILTILKQVAVTLSTKAGRIMTQNAIKNTINGLGGKLISASRTLLSGSLVAATKAAFSKAAATAVSKVTLKAIGARVVSYTATLPGKFAASLASGPIGWAVFVLQIVSMGLDIADVGGYGQITYLKEYIRSRDQVKATFESELVKAGLVYPFVVGPLSKFKMAPTAEELEARKIQSELEPESDIKSNTIPDNIQDLMVLIQTDYVCNYISMVTDLSKFKNADLSLTEIEDLCNQLAETALTFFDTPDGEKYLSEQMCKFADGIIVDDNGTCSFKNKETCDASYDWSTISTTGGTYVEWRDNKCSMENSMLRKSCEDKGLKYNYEDQLCVITDTYCREYGEDPFINEDGRKDCKINDAQNVAEMIFGTTITRGLKQVFDPDQYKPCEPDEVDANNLNQHVKNLLYASMLLPPPFNIPGDLYAKFGNKTCWKDACTEGTEESTAGLCYAKCRPGYNSDTLDTCYKQYPNWEVPGSSLTYVAKTTVKVTPAGSCPDGKERDGALCYSKCDPGHRRSAGVCYEQCNPDTQNSVGASGASVVCRNKCANGYSTLPGDLTGTCYFNCGPNQTQSADGLSCRDNCPNGYSSDGAITCWLNDATYVRGSGRIPDKSPCSPGQNDDGTSCHHTRTDCADDCGKGWDWCRRRGAFNECVGGCRLSCWQVSNGIAKYTWERNQCRADEELRMGLCYPKCRPGYWSSDGHVTICTKINDNNPLTRTVNTQIRGSYVPDSVAVRSYMRDDPTPLVCPEGTRSTSAGLCEGSPPLGYRDNGAGLYVRDDCPLGASDTGLTCERERYSRGVAQPKLKLRFKERNVPWGTKEGFESTQQISSISEVSNTYSYICLGVVGFIIILIIIMLRNKNIL